MKTTAHTILSFMVISAAAVSSAWASGAHQAGKRVATPQWSSPTKVMKGHRVLSTKTRTWKLPEAEAYNDVFPHLQQGSPREHVLRLAVIHLDTTPLPPPLHEHARRIIYSAAQSAEAPHPTLSIDTRNNVTSMTIHSPDGELTIERGRLVIKETHRDGVDVTRTLSHDEETEDREEPLVTPSLARLEEILKEGKSSAPRQSRSDTEEK